MYNVYSFNYTVPGSSTLLLLLPSHHAHITTHISFELVVLNTEITKPRNHITSFLPYFLHRQPPHPLPRKSFQTKNHSCYCRCCHFLNRVSKYCPFQNSGHSSSPTEVSQPCQQYPRHGCRTNLQTNVLFDRH